MTATTSRAVKVFLIFASLFVFAHFFSRATSHSATEWISKVEDSTTFVGVPAEESQPLYYPEGDFPLHDHELPSPIPSGALAYDPT